MAFRWRKQLFKWLWGFLLVLRGFLPTCHLSTLKNVKMSINPSIFMRRPPHEPPAINKPRVSILFSFLFPQFLWKVKTLRKSFYKSDLMTYSEKLFIPRPKAANLTLSCPRQVVNGNVWTLGIIKLIYLKNMFPNVSDPCLVLKRYVWGAYELIKMQKSIWTRPCGVFRVRSHSSNHPTDFITGVRDFLSFSLEASINCKIFCKIYGAWGGLNFRCVYLSCAK